MSDLTTVANVKGWLTIPLANTTDDTLLTRLVTAVSTWIQNWIGKTIATATYTETVNGSGARFFAFLHDPVTAVASVTVDGTAIPARGAPGGSGYSFDKDFLYLDGYSFTKGTQNVVITYTAGYSATPGDLEQATIELCALRYRERDRIGLVSKGLAGETTTFMLKDLPADVQNILQSYKRVTPV